MEVDEQNNPVSTTFQPDIIVQETALYNNVLMKIGLDAKNHHSGVNSWSVESFKDYTKNYAEYKLLLCLFQKGQSYNNQRQIATKLLLLPPKKKAVKL